MCVFANEEDLFSKRDNVGLVPRAGLEPARSYDQRILSPQRLPFRHPGKLLLP